MPLRTFAQRPIPPDTLRTARASFGKNNLYMVVGDRLPQLLAVQPQKTKLESQIETKPPNLSVLSMVTIFQYLESLSDLQVIEAVRTRVDWKYALHLPMNYPGFAPNRLCRERYRLRRESGSDRVFQGMIDRVASISTNGSQFNIQVEAQTLVQTVCTICRMSVALQTMQIGLELLASRHWEWLRQHALPHWYERYSASNRWGGQFECSDLIKSTTRIGDDIGYLLERVERYGQPDMAAYQEIRDLEAVYHQQYQNGNGKRRWRTACCATCESGGGLYRD